MIKFLASKYEKDTGRKINFPDKISTLLSDPSLKGEHPLIEQEEDEFDKNALKGKLAAETLKKPLTFFEAVEKIPIPKKVEEDKKKGGGQRKKGEVLNYEPQFMISRIDLSGYKHLRFSRLALLDLVHGLSRLPVIRSVCLRGNGIDDTMDSEIM